jgi:3-oxoacyl-[acyl-carrier protein] reductase
MKNVLVFGSSGALGSAISDEFENLGFNVIRLTSATAKEACLSTQDVNWPSTVCANGKITAAIWAQGFNQSDSIETFSVDTFSKHVDANLTYILETLGQLISTDAFSNDARIVVLSSIWQDSSRRNKLSYIVTKSALKGLVSSLCLELGSKGISINAVLPGVTDTPMTHRNLDANQIAHVIDETPLGQLPKIEDVSRTVTWLASQESKGINGQFVTVDNGWTRHRNV